MNWLVLALITVVILLILIRLAAIKRRGYFFKTKKGEKLGFKKFMKRWGEGIDGITPLQQAQTSMWCMLPIFAGLLWGAFITFFGHTYWLTLILVASLPLTAIQFIGSLQKYRKFKIIEIAMKSARFSEEKE